MYFGVVFRGELKIPVYMERLEHGLLTAPDFHEADVRLSALDTVLQCEPR